MKKVIIGREGGLNLNITAMFVQKAYQLQQQYDTQLILHYQHNTEIPCTNFGVIVDLKIKKGDSIYLSSRNQESDVAVQKMISFLSSSFQEDNEIKQGSYSFGESLDKEVTLMLDMVWDGICILDKGGYITFANTTFANVVNRPGKRLIGKYINDIIHNLWGNGNLLGKKQVIGSVSCVYTVKSLVFSVKPILIDGVISGSILTVKDQRELHYLKEKNEILKLKTENLENILSKEKAASWYPHKWVGESPEQKFIKKMKFGPAFEKFIGMNEKVLTAIALAAKAAKVQSTVLIIGKSGTGKEVIAEGVHLASPRAKEAFIKVNCAAIPENLLESELFGHEKGAFTGAIKKKLGKFELADGGSIFLDEIGEMDLGMQTKLLRVLQTSAFERVGGEETITVNVRVIAATNRDLEKMVHEGSFREDLYYRLNVIPLCLPSLKERKDDIPLIVDHFLKKFNSNFSRSIQGITKSAMDALIAYDWPGNVRELKNIIERFVALADGDYIEFEDLPDSIQQYVQVKTRGNKSELMPTSIVRGEVFLLEEYEKQIITAALDKYGSYTAAGKVLGITHKTVAAKVQKYGIDKT